MSLQQRGIAYFAAGVGFGIAAGSLIGLLYAPQTGRKTRRQLSSAIENGADRVNSKAQHTRDYLQKRTLRLRKDAVRLKKDAAGLLDRGKAVLEDGSESIEHAFAAGAKLYRQATH